MRQRQRNPKDVSHIELNDKSMHKTAEAAAREAAAESQAQQARKVELKLHTRRKAAHVSNICLPALPKNAHNTMLKRAGHLHLYTSMTVVELCSSWRSCTNVCQLRTS